MSPIRDTGTKITFATAGMTSADIHVLSSAFEFDGTPLKGLCLKVTCGSMTGTSPTLSVYIHASTSTTAATTTSKIVGQRASMTGAAASEYKNYLVPFVAPDARSIKVMCEMGGTTVTAALTIPVVQLYLVQNVGLDWDRSINFH
jgi:hypothetical protein